MHIQHIPLTKLTLSKSNVRKSGAANGLDELAASIAAHGLLQNLSVRALSKQKFEVVAGGRRLAALKRLAKDKRLKKDAPIPCNVLDTEDSEEISLAENVVRLPMHPADQFDAFQKLMDGGKGPEEIAARFGVSATTVKQRLKLAKVSPVLIEAYRAEEIDLDLLTAFAVTDDHAAQERCLADLPDWNRQPFTVRRILTDSQIEADDARARFVGMDAYQAAGGQITRDLFQPDHEGYFTDAALLERLVAEKLDTLAETYRAEGWAWVVIDGVGDPQGPWARQEPSIDLSPEDQQRLDALTSQRDDLTEAAEQDDEACAAYDALEETIHALETMGRGWNALQRAQTGVRIRVGNDGRLDVHRGLLYQTHEEARAAQANQHKGSERVAPEGGLPAKLIEDLTAHRSAALQALLADHPRIALAVTVHALAWPVFYGTGMSPTCLEITARQPDLSRSSPTLAASPAAQLMAERRDAWQQRLPQDDEAFLPWLLAQEIGALTELLAVVAALTVNAVRPPQSHHGAPRFAHANQLATALGLNMTEWWQPTGETYLSRVSKSQVLDAVKEAVSPQAAENLATLKKAELVSHAEDRLAGRGWLPQPLRSAAA